MSTLSILQTLIKGGDSPLIILAFRNLLSPLCFFELKDLHGVQGSSTILFSELILFDSSLHVRKKLSWFVK